jgi:hypothetical protein
MKLAVTADHGTLTASATITLDAELAQPVRVDWGDGTAVQQLASGFTNPTTHVYAKDGVWKITVQGNDVRATETVRVGSPATPAWNQDKIKERREAAADEVAGMGATTGVLG